LFGFLQFAASGGCLLEIIPADPLRRLTQEDVRGSSAIPAAVQSLLLLQRSIEDPPYINVWIGKSNVADDKKTNSKFKVGNCTNAAVVPTALVPAIVAALALALVHFICCVSELMKWIDYFLYCLHVLQVEKGVGLVWYGQFFTAGVQAFELPVEHAKRFIVDSLKLAHGNHASHISWQKLTDQAQRLDSGFSAHTLRRARDDLLMMNEIIKIRRGELQGRH
jgi:hypothetical protein